MKQSQLNQSQPSPPPPSTSSSQPPPQLEEREVPPPLSVIQPQKPDPPIKQDSENPIVGDVVDPIADKVATDELLTSDDKTTTSSTSLSNNDNNNNTSSNTDDDDKISTKSSNDGRIDRRVSFPKQDDKLVTGYLEPANPWASVKKLRSSNDLELLYRDSCTKHATEPIEWVLEHLKTIDLKSNDRLPILNLKEHVLTPEACEALEEILKRVQYRCIDVSSCGLDDVSASALFDMIEYYEAANELDISENRNITNIGWQSCISMVKKSHALQVLSVRATALTDNNASNLGKAMLTSSLHTLKLEHCGLTGRPISSLCTSLKRNVVLRELWLAHNDLTQHDAYNIALLLKSNHYIQYLDISNNYIEDSGVGYIVDALIEQTQKLNELNMPSSSSTSTSSIISPLTALPPASESLTTLTTSSSSSLSSSSSSNNNTNNINKSDDSNNNKILSDIDKNNKEISISSIQIEDPDDSGINGDRNLKIDDGGGGGGGDGGTTLNNNNNNNNSDSSSNSNNLNKMSGRSKLDVLLTNLNENNSDNQNNYNNDDSILVQKTNIDLLTTIYEHQNNNKNIDKSNNNESGIITTSVNNNDNPKVQEETEEDVASIIVIAKKLDTVNEEESDDNDTASNSGDGDIMSTTSGTTEPIIDDVKPNIINNNNNSSNDILVQTEIPNNVIELKIVEDTDYTCDENNDKNNSVNNNNDNSINEDLLEKSTESFEFIDPNAIDIIIPIATSSSSTILAPLLESNNNANSSNSNDCEKILSQSLDNNNTNGSTSEGEKVLSQSFDDSILLKPDLSITTNNNNNNKTNIESITHEQKPLGSPVTITTVNLPPPERSLSSDSLNSDTSIDSNDSKSSIKLAEMKFGTRNNGTLERQQQINDKLLSQEYSNITQPTGLQVLIFWNNQITRHSSKSFSDLLSKNNSLEILNVGRNVLSNDFITNIKPSLKQNTTLTNLGLQGAHLSCPGIKGLSEILDFGGNSTLQRIDLRDNNIETAGLGALDEAMKSNKSVTQIDLDDTPRKIVESSGNSTNDYTRLVTSIRGHCTRNEKPPQETELIKPNLKKVRSAYKCSRKISLTCQSVRPTSNNEQIDRNLLDPNNKHFNTQHGHNLNSNNCLSNGTTIKSIGRLKSPLPSPNPSPMSSPIPSPSRNRFHVSKVLENINSTSPSSSSLISTSSSTNSSPSSYSNSRFRVTAVSDINKKPVKIENSRFTVQTLVSKPIVNITPITVPPPPPPPPPVQPVVKPVREDTDQNHFQFNFDDTSTNLMRNTVMGDSCSSLSSMDSIDRPFNSSSNDDSSSIDNIIISPKFLDDSLSSLEDNFIEVNRKEVLIANPSKKIFSKDDDDNDTLTNSTAKQTSTTNTTNFLNTDKNATKNSASTNTSGSGRVRKTSFFGPSNSTNEPNYTPPPAIAQLLSIFKKSDNTTITNSSSNHQPSTQLHAIRKESPMSGLFAHLFTSSSSSNKSKQNVEEIAVQPPLIKPLSTSSSATNSSNSSNSQILQHKFSDNSILTDSHAAAILSHSSTNLENTKIPVELKQEIKENISPENTITAENLLNIEQPIVRAQEIEPSPPVERVHFEVGGDDDEDDDMEIDTANENDMSIIDDITISTSTSTTATGNLNTNSNNSITTTVVGDSKSSSVSSMNLSYHATEHSLNSKLGQIARDSLAMLKGSGSNDSQDSMVSFDNDSQQNPHKNTSPIVEVLSALESTTQITPQPVITITTQEAQQHQHETNEP